ncbi:MAG: MlaD family protein [Opitutales bacterium]
MSKRANPVTIGIFVVSAFVLLLGTLSFLGATKLMRENPRYVLFFDESVNGLDVGAWVKFKGVPVGRVAEIRIRMPNQLPELDGVPVIIELYDQHIVDNLGAQSVVSDPENLAQHIRLGLRARLNTESLITGLLFVELDYVENAPEPIYYQDVPELLEIPTVPSQLQEIARNATAAIAKIGDIDFAELGRNMNRLLFTVNARVDQLDVRGLSSRMNNILGEIESIVEGDRMVRVVENLDSTVLSIQAVSNNINDALPQLLEDVNRAVESLDTTFEQATKTLESVDNAVSPKAKLYKELVATVEEAQATLRAVKDLAVFIENNPNALVTGRSDT